MVPESSSAFLARHRIQVLPSLAVARAAAKALLDGGSESAPHLHVEACLDAAEVFELEHASAFLPALERELRRVLADEPARLAVGLRRAADQPARWSLALRVQAPEPLRVMTATDIF